MSKEQLKLAKIYIGNEIKAELIKGILKDCGVSSYIVSTMPDCYLGLSCESTLIIKEDDLSKSLEIIKGLEEDIPAYSKSS